MPATGLGGQAMLEVMDEWFGGRVEGGEHAQAFLDAARQAAPDLLGGLVDPDNTGAVPYGCLLMVDVPGVLPSEWPVNTHLLQVMFAPGWVGGYWGCSHLWDDWDADDPEALVIDGEHSPEELGRRAVSWSAEQLRRPLVRQERAQPHAYSRTARASRAPTACT